jgi:hypothetical protein
MLEVMAENSEYDQQLFVEAGTVSISRPLMSWFNVTYALR